MSSSGTDEHEKSGKTDLTVWTLSGTATLARLGAERRRIGFAPLGVRDYLESLAQSAQVVLQPVLRWADIAELSSVGPRLARGWACLADCLGMELSEALQHFRISFAESRGETAFSASLARTGEVREQTDPFAEAELVFKRWARTLQPAQQEELGRAEAEIHSFFDARQHQGE